MLEHPHGETLKVKYPLTLLLGDASLFDPANHDSVYTYYLAENLGAGLVRDDTASPSGYAPILAASWTWDGDKVWKFHLRPDARWSDGSPVTGEQIVELMHELASGTHRHLQKLRDLKSVAFDEPSQVLTLVFGSTTTDAILHELSLADAILYRRDQAGKPRWDVTSGPYYVSTFVPGRELELRKNRHSVLASAEAPDGVRLSDNSPPKDHPTEYPFGDADLANVPAPTFSQFSQSLMRQAAEIKEGATSSIIYFAVNPDHPLSGDGKARRELRLLLQRALGTTTLPRGVHPERQMIPAAYDGRLSSSPDETGTIETLRGKTVVLQVIPSIKDLGDETINHLYSVFSTETVELKLKYLPYFEKNPDNDHMAQIRMFAGNQKDASGSWSFHFSRDGNLWPFRHDYEEGLRRVADAESTEVRTKALADLHMDVLDKAHLIPVLSAANYAAHSTRVSLDRWNPFDMRMRFYEVRWR
jgi:ABC-type transport system substrate-binding protein